MWVLLATLGVPVWLIVGAMLATIWSRRAHAGAPGVFPCKIRTLSGAAGSRRWSRRPAYARWVHDVLLVHSGMALVRYDALPVRAVDGPIAKASGVKLRGGGELFSLRMTLDDGSVLEG